LGHSHHHSHSTSLEGESDDILEKLDIIYEPVEEHRTLLLINEDDHILYKEIKEWANENHDSNLNVRDAILKFGKEDFGAAKFPTPPETWRV
jgi:hypothetical protein